MVTVQSVATATEIVIISVWGEHVINVVVQSLEADGFALFVALRGMVEYNVQDDFNTVGMKLTNQRLKLSALLVVFIGCRIAAVRCKESDCIVAPAFEKLFAVNSTGIHGFVKFKDRHEFYRVDPEFFKVWDFFHQAGKSTSVSDTRRRMMCKITNM